MEDVKGTHQRNSNFSIDKITWKAIETEIPAPSSEKFYPWVCVRAQKFSRFGVLKTTHSENTDLGEKRADRYPTMASSLLCHFWEPNLPDILKLSNQGFCPIDYKSNHVAQAIQSAYPSPLNPVITPRVSMWLTKAHVDVRKVTFLPSFQDLRHYRQCNFEATDIFLCGKRDSLKWNQDRERERKRRKTGV
jgi:hypothetical protein